MFAFVLSIHALVRWVILLALAVRSGWGWMSLLRGEADAKLTKILGLATIIFLDFQFLLGLLLHLGLSDLTRSAMGNMGATMGNSVLRFWTVEHPVSMLFAIALAHIAYRSSKRSEFKESAAIAVLFTVALLLVIAGIPWPFRADVGRPLF